MSPLILIAEDEPAQVEVLEYNFRAAGFRTIVAMDGAEALRLARDDMPDLVILDWMLPAVSGAEVCRRLRAQRRTRLLPIIMVTARGEEHDRLRGLESGADDYVVKPYSPKELIARVRAVLRRATEAPESDVFDYGGVRMDLASHKVTRDRETLHLSPTEFRLLRTLLERPGQVFSRAQLLDRVWGRDLHVGPRTVDAHVQRLRTVLNAKGGRDIIRTVRGEGYAADVED